jgi:nucleotide-binding universal stress UspA family protein
VYDDVLVPTDGSEAAEQALRHAIGAAVAYDARVHALYVVETSAHPSLRDAGSEVLDAMEDEGREAVETVRRAAENAGRPTTVEVGEGSPAETIVHYAEEHDVDVVVMGTNGRRGIERYVIGSVTERVVRTSPVPVLTVRRDEG